MHRFQRVTIAVAAGYCALLFMADEAAGAGWEVKTISDGRKHACVAESSRSPVSDGYQDITVQLIVDDKTVSLKSDSILDIGSSDIGLTVGPKELVPADRLATEHVAVFSSRYGEIVQLFKAGKDAHAQLRFWPTWPKTGTHNATFSLIGFTKAYDEAMKCAQ